MCQEACINIVAEYGDVADPLVTDTHLAGELNDVSRRLFSPIPLSTELL